LNCCVERDGNIEIFSGGGWLGEQLSAWKEGILLQHSVFIPYANFFSERLKGKGQCKLAAQRIAVGTNVTQDSEAPMLT
jgi:hypothetical protein